MKNLILILSVFLLLGGCGKETQKISAGYKDLDLAHLLVGSYSDGTTPGISVFRFNMQNANIEYVSELDGVLNPSYLAVSSDKKLIYSVNETPEGAVSVFNFDKQEGKLRFINSQPVNGADPCYISIDKAKRFIVTANYNDGSISVFPLSSKGEIQPVSQYMNMNDLFSVDKKVSHIHTVVFSPDGNTALVTDLGKNMLYEFAVNKMNTVKNYLQDIHIIDTDKGPRHLVFHPNGRYFYCINELSGTVSVFRYNNENGIVFKQKIDSDINTEIRDKGSADIHISPDGRFLYTSNRLGNDGIAIFSIDPGSGLLTKVGYQETGIHPRNFVISPNGRYLLCANRDSNNIQIFEINLPTGLLENTGKYISIDKPACLKWIY